MPVQISPALGAVSNLLPCLSVVHIGIGVKSAPWDDGSSIADGC